MRTAATTKPTAVIEKPGVQLQDVSMTYRSAAGDVNAIANVTGHIPEGRFISVIGPSGCGKSTLLDLVGGLIRPSTGSVSIDGERVVGARRDTAMVFQGDSTLHWRSVIDNVAFGLEVGGVPKKERLERARHFLDLVGLAGFDDQHPRALSGGMRQRVAIARAHAMEPRVLLMDEPFGALDQQTRRFIGRELLRIWDETKNSVLFVTHDIHEAVYLSDEVWVMSNRPSTVCEKLIVDLERPRPTGITSSAEFIKLADQLWQLLRAESERAFQVRESVQ